MRAGLCDTLDGYEWSSHGGYISKAKKWDWLFKEFVLSLLNTDGKSIIRKYKTFMGLDDSEEISAFFSKKNLPSILGDESFITWLKETYFRDKSNQEIPDSKCLAPEIHTIIKIVSDVYRVDETSLLRARRGVENEPRNVAVYLSRYLRAEPLQAIGAEFNLKRYSSVSSILERVNRKLSNDKRFMKKVNNIKQMIERDQT